MKRYVSLLALFLAIGFFITLLVIGYTNSLGYKFERYEVLVSQFKGKTVTDSLGVEMKFWVTPEGKFCQVKKDSIKETWETRRFKNDSRRFIFYTREEMKSTSWIKTKEWHNALKYRDGDPMFKKFESLFSKINY